jgi:hypothetical protein
MGRGQCLDMRMRKEMMADERKGKEKGNCAGFQNSLRFIG